MLEGYKRVPRMFKSGTARACTGCAFDSDGEATQECGVMKKLGNDDHTHEQYWCPTTIWIADTPEAIAAYMADRLTNS